MKQTLFFLLFPILLLCQKEDYNWIFNFTDIRHCSNAPDINPLLPVEGFCPTVFSFHTDPPTYYQDENIYLDFLLTNSIFSSPEGDLLFYSNGQSIHGRDHIPVPGADSISYGPAWESRVWNNEYGEQETTGYDQTYGAVFITKPGTDKEYYLLYNDYNDIFLDRRYGYVNKMFAELIVDEAGLAVATQKDIVFAEKISSSNMVTCAQHANGRDWWLLQLKDDMMQSYLIDPQGIRLFSESELAIEIDSISGGSTKFNKQGDKFAIYQNAELFDSLGNELIIADFDRCSGSYFNEQKYNLSSLESFFSNGLEFSSSGRFLYINDLFSVYQLDLEASDIIGSMTKVMAWDSTYSRFPGLDTLSGGDMPISFGFMQRGPDDKIYIGNGHFGYHIHIIHEPDRSGLACRPENKAIRLLNYHLGGLPNFPTLRLGPLDGSSCDTLGIDNRPVAKFRFEQDEMDTLMIDFVDLSFYEPTTWRWDFGDGNSSTERHPLHLYSQPGTYEVCLEVNNAFSSDVSCDTIFLGMLSSSEDLPQRNITLFPNPVLDDVRVSFHDYLPLDAVIKLHDNSGKLVTQKPLSGQSTTIDLMDISAGIYFYEIWDNGVRLKMDKLIKVNLE